MPCLQHLEVSVSHAVTIRPLSCFLLLRIASLLDPLTFVQDMADTEFDVPPIDLW